MREALAMRLDLKESRVAVRIMIKMVVVMMRVMMVMREILHCQITALVLTRRALEDWIVDTVFI